MKHKILIFFFLPFITFAQAQRPVPTLSLQQVQGFVHIIDGGLGNMTLLDQNNEVLLVDTKAEEAGVALEEFFKVTLKGNRKIKYIINTHKHWDHTGNNKRLAKGAIIIAQQNARKEMEKDTAKWNEGWPNMTFDKEMTLYFAGEEIRIIHYPLSHTNHDLVVYFTKSKVISMGDMYFSGMYPYITDDGDLKSLTANLDAIIKMLPPDIKIVPGHGPVSTLADLKATHKMLVETTAFIQKQITAGKTLEVIKKEGLPAWTAVWGKGFCKEECWIETVYDFLKK